MSRGKVLIVGGTLKTLDNVVDRLRDWGVEYRFTLGCATALEVLEEQHFDLVLTKLRLPDSNAFELVPVAEKLRMALYAYFPARGDFWWLPLVTSGRACASEHAMQTAEFLRAARSLLSEAGASIGTYAASPAEPRF